MVSDGENGAWRKSGSIFLLHGLLKHEGEKYFTKKYSFFENSDPMYSNFWSALLTASSHLPIVLRIGVISDIFVS